MTTPVIHPEAIAVAYTFEEIAEIKRDAKRSRRVKGQGPSVLKDQQVIDVAYHSTTDQGNNRRLVTLASGYQFVTAANSHAGLSAENYKPVSMYKNGEYQEVPCTVDIALNGWGCITGFHGPDSWDLRRFIDSL